MILGTEEVVSETLIRLSHTYKQKSWLHTYMYSARREGGGYLPTYTKVHYVCMRSMHRRNDHKFGQLVWGPRNSVPDASRKVNIKPSGGALWICTYYGLDITCPAPGEVSREGGGGEQALEQTDLIPSNRVDRMYYYCLTHFLRLLTLLRCRK